MHWWRSVCRSSWGDWGCWGRRVLRWCSTLLGGGRPGGWEQKHFCSRDRRHRLICSCDFNSLPSCTNMYIVSIVVSSHHYCNLISLQRWTHLPNRRRNTKVIVCVYVAATAYCSNCAQQHCESTALQPVEAALQCCRHFLGWRRVPTIRGGGLPPPNSYQLKLLPKVWNTRH